MLVDGWPIDFDPLLFSAFSLQDRKTANELSAHLCSDLYLDARALRGGKKVKKLKRRGQYIDLQNVSV
jgi:hypothetical protein